VYKASELGQGPPINLKGVAIGNGMTNPAVQFPAYADFALQNKLISESVSGSEFSHKVRM
jgi:carboxypeptidase C (cathepsin A)